MNIQCGPRNWQLNMLHIIYCAIFLPTARYISSLNGRCQIFVTIRFWCERPSHFCAGNPIFTFMYNSTWNINIGPSEHLWRVLLCKNWTNISPKVRKNSMYPKWMFHAIYSPSEQVCLLSNKMHFFIRAVLIVRFNRRFYIYSRCIFKYY